MKQRLAIQPKLPRLEADGQTHDRDCECARCEAGFAPSEAQRDAAARSWTAQQEREAAALALEKKRARERTKALRLTLELEEEERQTEARLRGQAALVERLRADERLEAMLESRRAGRPIAEALAAAERVGPARP